MIYQFYRLFLEQAREMIINGRPWKSHANLIVSFRNISLKEKEKKSYQQLNGDFLFDFRQLAKEFSDLLKQDRSPVNVASSANGTNGVSNSRHAPGSSLIAHRHLHSIPGSLDPHVQDVLTNFSLMTHGFGAPALAAAVDVFQQYLTEMLKYYEKNYPMFIATTSTSSSIKNGGGGGID
jgi:hypothetical protein